MSRDLSSADKTQATSTYLAIVEFLSIALPTGTLYLTSGDRAYTWGGHTYQPSNGQWGTVGNYNETLDTVPRAMSLQLSGVDATLISNIVGNDCEWVAISYDIGFIDGTGALIADPSFMVSAYLGDCTIRADMNAGTISISAENLLADLQNRNSGCLQTDADQQARFSGDTFFQDIASVINKVIYWGQYGPGQVGGYGAVSPVPTAPSSMNKDLPQ